MGACGSVAVLLAMWNPIGQRQSATTTEATTPVRPVYRHLFDAQRCWTDAALVDKCSQVLQVPPSCLVLERGETECRVSLTPPSSPLTLKEDMMLPTFRSLDGYECAARPFPLFIVWWRWSHVLDISTAVRWLGAQIHSVPPVLPVRS